MAAATKEQITALEKALADQFYYLVQGAALRIAIARKYGLNSTGFKKYNSEFVPLVNKWIQREVKYERELVKKHIYGIIASGDLKADDFFYSEQIPKLVRLVKKWNAEKTTQGHGLMGFIPILVWAAIAAYALWTVKQVTDDMTTTTQEKEHLLQVTAETVKDLGLTPDQAAALISQTQAQASEGSGLGDIIKYGLLGLLGLFAVQTFNKN